MAVPKGTRIGGRKKGTPNRVNLAARLRIEEKADPLGFFIKIATGKDVDGTKPTLDQRIHAQGVLLRKIIPDAKSAPIKLALPKLETVADVVKAHAVVIAAMGAGTISPDEAATIADVLESKRRAIETTALEERLAKLESAFANRRSGA